MPLEIYIQTKDKRCLEVGQGLADKQWENPALTGITREARFWIDDMYMIPAVQVQAYRATGDAKYIDHAALAMVAYLDKLQQPNGLFHHGTDSPFLWGRGNGWVAAGMTELLRSMLVSHPRRARIMEGYKRMMASLLEYQDPNGMWHQLIDRPEAWPETSGTGMFAFAMVTGVKNGWLDAKTYGPAGARPGLPWWTISTRTPRSATCAKGPTRAAPSSTIWLAAATEATCTARPRSSGPRLRCCGDIASTT